MPQRAVGTVSLPWPCRGSLPGGQRSSSARPVSSGNASAAPHASPNATANTTNANAVPPTLSSSGTLSGARIEAIRPNAAALPDPVPRSGVGYSSGVTAYRAPQAPRLNAESVIPAAMIIPTESAWPNQIAATADPARNVASVGRRPHFSIRNAAAARSEEHTSELQSRGHLVCRLLLE